jgi:hypothetical protein
MLPKDANSDLEWSALPREAKEQSLLLSLLLSLKYIIGVSRK